MKNKVLLVSLIAIVCLSFAAPTEAANMAQKLKGKILLQVEANGEAWYVHPETQDRYLLGNPEDAMRVMESLGLGISENDYVQFSKKMPAKFAGKILMRVKAHGEAYYVHPQTLKMHFLSTPQNALKVMKEVSLGISNTNLEKIPLHVKDCGKSTQIMSSSISAVDKIDDVAFSCFYGSVRACQPTKMLNTVKAEIINDATSFLTKEYRILGWKGKNCEISIKITDADSTYGPKHTKILQEQGDTLADIQKYQKAESAVMKKDIGKSGKCVFTLTNLSLVVAAWNEKGMTNESFESTIDFATGSTTSLIYGGDWAKAESCDGTYFGKAFGKTTAPAETIKTTTKTWADFDKCKNVTFENGAYTSQANSCTETCANCKIGVYTCMFKTVNDDTEYRCVQCTSDFSCKDGFSCENNQCAQK